MSQGVTKKTSVTEQRALVEGILKDENDAVLLLQRSEHETYAGQWQPPAGKIEYGEAPEDALGREFYEETGIEVEPRQPFDVQDYLVDGENTENGGARHSIIISYLVDPVDDVAPDDVTLSDEHQAYDWVQPDEAQDWNLVGTFYDTLDQLEEQGSYDP